MVDFLALATDNLIAVDLNPITGLYKLMNHNYP